MQPVIYHDISTNTFGHCICSYCLIPTGSIFLYNEAKAKQRTERGGSSSGSSKYSTALQLEIACISDCAV